jgi:anthranilate/para-aminobenzoate synthase component I
VWFEGGLEALDSAWRWVRGHAGGPAQGAVLVGAIAYHLGCELEPRAPAPREPDLPPPVDLAGFRALYLYDAMRAEGAVVGSDPRAVDELRELIASAAARAPARGSRLPRLGRARPDPGAPAYRAAVERIRAWIRAGDVYQVNLARRLELSAPGVDDARALHARLVRGAGAPFAAYLETPRRRILSNSPERFLRVCGGRVETCPIKGTRPRGSTPEQDALLAKELLGSPKDGAEHLMIVDLERNDLGRVCCTGSVEVVELEVLRSYPGVHHLVSSVQGDLRPGVELPELLRATFPGGSITGAPKLRAMQIIDELEPGARDVYTGAIGYVDASGDLDFSIAIRTAVQRGSRLYLHVGGGIVADSDPEAELAETETKAAAFRELWGIGA